MILRLCEAGYALGLRLGFAALLDGDTAGRDTYVRAARLFSRYGVACHEARIRAGRR
jgi:hypothetical protein